MNVPVDAGALVEVGIGLGKEPRGEIGRDDARDELVECDGEEDLVRVQGECREGEAVRERGDEVREEGRRGREGVVHCLKGSTSG